MRIYLSGPISGVGNYLDVFNRAAAILAGEGYHVINPANMVAVMDNGATWDDYMVIDEELLHLCDAVVQLPGWQKSLGCQREYGMAKERDMLILSLEDLVSGSTEKGR